MTLNNSRVTPNTDTFYAVKQLEMKKAVLSFNINYSRNLISETVLVQKYYFDAEYSAVRNDREISINSF